MDDGPGGDEAAPVGASRGLRLSPSRAEDYMRCPLLYRFRVVDRLPEPPNGPAARGTLVHAVLERLFDLPAEERDRAAAERLLAPQWARLVEERPELADLLAESPGAGQAWFDAALALLDRWFTLEDPTRLEPHGRELHLEAVVDGLPLHGYVDRLDVAPDGRMRVVDYKTGRSPAPEREAGALFQMKFYALLLSRLRGRIPSRLQLVYLGDGQILTYDPDEDDLRGVGTRIRALWEAISTALVTGDFRPSPGPGCGRCAHRAVCPAWGGTPPPWPGLPPHAPSPTETRKTTETTAAEEAGAVGGVAGAGEDRRLSRAAPDSRSDGDG